MKNNLSMVLMSLLILFVTTGLLHPLSVQNPNEEMDPEFIGGYVEGDMIVDIMRNTVIAPARKWPFCKVPYLISCKTYNAAQLAYIYKGFAEISAITGLVFQRISKPDPDTLGYINISCKGDGCYARVGFNKGEVPMNLQNHPLDTGCFRYGVVLHEMLHTIGFHHQQSAYNRDSYVKILWENIIEDRITVFSKQSNTQYENVCSDYDYGSIMHYPPLAFSKNKLPTIEPLQQNVTIGQRLGFSEIDKCRLRKMYCMCHK